MTRRKGLGAGQSRRRWVRSTAPTSRRLIVVVQSPLLYRVVSRNHPQLSV